MENNKKLRRTDKRDKRERFSIRKFNVGVASVAVAAFWLISGSQAVAAEQLTEGTAVETTVAASSETSESSSEAVVTEVAPATEAATVEAPVVEAAEAPATVEAPATEVTEVAPAAEPAEEAKAAEVTEAPAEEAKEEVKAEETAPKAEETKEEAKAAETTAPVAEEKAAVAETAAPVEVVAPVRTAATTYRVRYVDVETAQTVKQTNGAVSEQTTTPADQAHTFEVNVNLETPTGYRAVSATNGKGQEFAIVNNAIAAAIVERDSASRSLFVNVRKDDQSAAPAPKEGFSGFRAVPIADAPAPAADGSGSRFDVDAVLATPQGSVSREEFIASQPVAPTAPFVSDGLRKDIRFFDFNQANVVEGSLDALGRIQVGTTWENEIYPGYKVRVKVTELKPLEATPEYLEMAKEIDRINGTDYATTVYNPNQLNGLRNGTVPPGNQGSFKVDQGAFWHNIAANGINTGNQMNRLIPYQATGASAGVRFEVKAIINGQEQPIDIITGDGESLTNREVTYSTTNGSNWELLAIANGNANDSDTGQRRPFMINTPEAYSDAHRTVNQPDSTTTYNDNPLGGGLSSERLATHNPQAYINPYPNAGLGTKMLGGYYTVLHSYPGSPSTPGAHVVGDLASPIFISRQATEFGYYVNAAGTQSMVLGFLVQDRSDAPESYGQASHGISHKDITGADRQVPFLGSVAPDMDDSDPAKALGGHYGDDDSVGINEATTPDEGEEQLAANNRYEIVEAGSNTYSLTLKASADVSGNFSAPASVKGWVDFNNDGVFQANEASNVATVNTQNGTVTLTFNSGSDAPIVPESVDASKLTARVRIAMDAAEIAEPTGHASSGEVEDFQVLVAHPPKGTYEHTEGFQGEKQTGVVNFTARGNQLDMSDARPTVRETNPTTANTMSAAPGSFGIVSGDALVQSLTVPGEGTYTVVSGDGNTVTIDFQPEAGFTGVAQGVVVRATDANGLTSNWKNETAGEPNTAGAEESPEDRAKANLKTKTWDSLYIPEVKTFEVKPVERETTGLQGQPQESPADFVATLVDEDGQPLAKDNVKITGYEFAEGGTTKTIAGEGTYTLDPATGKVTFQPEPGFTGKGTGVDVVATATVTAADGSSTSTKTATNKYTPNVDPITPTAEPATTEDKQGVTQNTDAKALFTSGDEANGTIVPIDNSTITLVNDQGEEVKEIVVPGEGTYTLKEDGTIDFKPEPQFTGTAKPVAVRAKDTNGTAVDTTYTPTVTPVTPTAEPATTEDKQGVTQNTDAKALFTSGDEANGTIVPIDNSTITLVNDQGEEVKEIVVPGEGTYTLKEDGTIDFKPEPQFTGTAKPVAVRAKDTNGTAVDTTYTPTVTPVTPTAEPATTEDKQGVTQNTDAKALFTSGDEANGTIVPIDNSTITLVNDQGEEVKEIVVPGEGTYTLKEDGTIDFKPEPQFTGTAKPVAVRAKDTNGTAVDTTYTPTVTPVTPTAEPATTEDKQGVTQNTDAKALFTSGDEANGTIVPIDNSTITLVNDQGEEVKEIVVPGEGTYTLKEDGTIDFKPEPQFTGTAKPVAVRAKDTNGTAVDTTYTPTVTPVTPTAEPATTEDKQGVTQNTDAKALFTSGDEANGTIVPIDNSTITLVNDQGEEVKEIVVPGEGTYTLKEDGTIDFKPEPQFTGTAKPVAVRAKDTNGTAVDTTYTPTVTPVTPTAEPATTEDKQGVTQNTDAKALFTEGDAVAPIDNSTITLVDAEGNEVKEIVVPGEGTYTLKEDGTIDFKPEPTFTGTATPVTVKAKDANGTPVETTYTPTVTPVVPTAEPATTEDKQGVTQNTDAKALFTEGDAVAPIDNSTITLVDAEGNEVKEIVVPGEGTYTLKEDGTIDFKPEPTFTGTATPVTVKAKDANGTPVETTYTPTVTPVVPTAEPATTEDKQGVTQNTDAKALFTEGDAVAPIDNSTITLVDAEGNEVKEIVVPGEGTYTLKEDGTIDFKPEPTFTGTATPVTVKAKDANGTPVETTYTPTVTPVVPTAEPATTEDKQGVTQNTDAKALFTEGDAVAPIDNSTITLVDAEGNEVKEIVVPGEGTYTLKEDGTIDFKPEPTFTGTATPVTVKAKDANGTPVETTYTPTVTPVVPTAEPATTEDKQGVTQNTDAKALFTEGDAVAPIDNSTITLVDAEGNEVKEIVVPGEGTYTLKEDGTIDFKPEPTFTGTATPVTVKAKDANGTPVETTYTPTVTPVVPTGEDVTSKDIQGATQTGKPVFTEGDAVAPIDETVPATFEDGTTEKVVPGEGKYTVAPDGTVTFTPEPTFTGVAKGVTVKRVDTNGTEATAKYTPEVTPVVPTATPAETEGPQGQPQSGKPVFTPGDESAPINEDVPATFEDGTTEKTVPGEGVYTVAPDGTVTFTPEKNFVGTAQGVTVKRVDTNGTPVETTYTPTVTPVVPTAEDVTSKDIQGATQTGKPVFTPGDESAPIDEKEPATFEDGTTEKVVPGEGTYTVSPDGVVTFVPEKDFTGVAQGVTVKRVDTNGTEVTAKYTPEVTPVTPVGTPEETTDVQGKPQSAKVEFTAGDAAVPMDDTVPATFEDGTTEKTIPGEGTYTVAPDGTVTFTPEENFTGKGTGVTVVRQDVNGTKATATYTPNVTPKTTSYVTTDGTEVFPTEDGTLDPKVSEEFYFTGETRTDDNGNVTHVYAKKTTEHVAEDGTVLKPKEDGTNPTEAFEGYYVKETKTDENGNVTHVYAPVQTTYVLEDGTELKAPAQGQDPNAPIEGYEIVSTETDENGNVKNVYRKVETPVATPVTTYVDEAGNPIAPQKDGQDPNAPIEGYEIVSTETDENGNVKNVYRKVETPVATPVTTYVDEAGNPIAPQKDGQDPNAPIEGYEIVSTETDENGNVKNVYRKVETPVATPVTTYVDEAGNPIAPQKDGQDPNAPIEGYEIVSTETDENGNVKNVYRKVETPVATPVTTYVDEAGNPIAPQKDGQDPNAPIEGYEIVSTETDENGNVKNVYRKVEAPVATPVTTYVDEAGNPIAPQKDGQDPNAPIEGYEIVSTETDENGNVKNVYRKVEAPVATPVTTYVDEAGNTISPRKDGQDPNAPIAGYEIVSTTTDPATGNVINVYRRVVTPVTPITTFVDENGNPIQTPENGSNPNKPLIGYEIVSTTTNPVTGEVVNVYKKVPVTDFVDEDGQPLKGTENGAKPGEKIDGYYIVSTTTDPVTGNVVNNYRQVRTTFVDENGVELSPELRGAAASGRIPGYYVKETIVDDNGNVKHIYAKLTTSFVDENGMVVSPTEEGTNPNAPIVGYEIVSSTEDENGNVINVYRKVATATPVTTFVDENGNAVKAPVDGSKPNEVIDGYELVSSTTDVNGNVVNVYRKVVATTPVAPTAPVAPTSPAAPAPMAPAAPQAPAAPKAPVAAPAAPQYVEKGAAMLPETGEESSAAALAGTSLLMTALGLLGLRRRKED